MYWLLYSIMGGGGRKKVTATTELKFWDPQIVVSCCTQLDWIHHNSTPNPECLGPPTSQFQIISTPPPTSLQMLMELPLIILSSGYEFRVISLHHA